MKKEAPQKIGDYEILSLIGKGGMGEVLLAYDSRCKREVAIKRIRPDLKKHKSLLCRFQREAKISASLTHPGIISVYAIEEDYYVMPYVEGKTLKQKLYETQESIPALLPIFMQVCQTTAYIHSKGILHRDLKPENILVGKFGEVILLDWGLALEMEEPEEEIDMTVEEGLTHPGKLVGTVAYMSPERVAGKKADAQTEVYALGVILYQILTLHLPFERPPLKELMKDPKARYFTMEDPEEVAPYREVAPQLSQIVKRCLESDPSMRYLSVQAIIDDLKGYLEGGPQWFERSALHIQSKEDWEFQENVLISKSMALTQVTEETEWVMAMISEAAFADSIQLKTRVYIDKESLGIGFLLGVPERSEREGPFDGLCLWLGGPKSADSRLFRNTVEVMTYPDLFLQGGKWHSIIIEKRNNKIRFILDGIERLTYISHLPLFGTHVGILARDTGYKMEKIIISFGSESLQVSCLAIPDAFLALKQYKPALAEYQRIGYSFPGHTESREALFRAGITLLEQAKNEKQQSFYQLALEEFSKLHATAGAPLEYLGKALVYQSLREHSEEIKCLELGLRRYFKHPLVDRLRGQIAYRMHEAAQNDRKSAYQLMLIVLRLLPEVAKREDSRRLFSYLIKHWETLFFLNSPLDPTFAAGKSAMLCFAIPLAFWLASPYTLHEIASEIDNLCALNDIIYCLFELGSHGLASKLLSLHKDPLLLVLTTCHGSSLREAWKAYCRLGVTEMGVEQLRVLIYLMSYALTSDEEELIHEMYLSLDKMVISNEDQILIDSYRIWAYLKADDAYNAGKIFDRYPLELLNQETTWLHPLYGCYLYLTEGEEIALIHFGGVIDTPHPRSWALLGHELINHITEQSSWYRHCFMWERRQLYKLLTLYYSIADNPQMEAFYRKLEKEQYIYVE